MLFRSTIQEQGYSGYRDQRSMSQHKKWCVPYCSRIILDPLYKPQIKKTFALKKCKKIQSLLLKPPPILTDQYTLSSYNANSEGCKSLDRPKKTPPFVSRKAKSKCRSQLSKARQADQFHYQNIRLSEISHDSLEHPNLAVLRKQSTGKTVEQSIKISKIVPSFNPLQTLLSFNRTQLMKTTFKLERKFRKKRIINQRILNLTFTTEIDQKRKMQQSAPNYHPKKIQKSNKLQHFSPWQSKDFSASRDIYGSDQQEKGVCVYN